MKKFCCLSLILFFTTLPVSAAEVNVILKNGKQVTGAVLVNNDEKLVLLVTASNGVYRQEISKSDIAEIKEPGAAPEGPVGLKDLESLQRRASAAENEFRHREKLAAKAQDTLDEFIRTRQRAKESVMQRTSLDKRETELRVRLSSARARAELARSSFKTLAKELEAMKQKLAEQEPPSKK
jgi:hypothetical protein